MGGGSRPHQPQCTDINHRKITKLPLSPRFPATAMLTRSRSFILHCGAFQIFQQRQRKREAHTEHRTQSDAENRLPFAYIFHLSELAYKPQYIGPIVVTARSYVMPHFGWLCFAITGVSWSVLSQPTWGSSAQWHIEMNFVRTTHAAIESTHSHICWDHIRNDNSNFMSTAVLQKAPSHHR